jgi:DNA-binding response OmpR family regulator
MDPSFTPRTKLRVLVADDEHIIADTLGIILNQNGFDAAAVYSGKNAVETARHFQPNIFLGDVVMPDMNGIDAAIQICAMIPACRILLLSGQAATTDLLRAAGPQGRNFEILLKPIHPTQLLARLRAT